MSIAKPDANHNRPSRSGVSNEVQLTLLLFLFSFLISGIPRVYTQTASYTLFIEAYGAGALPWAYLAQSLCIPLAGYLYIRAERSLNLPQLQVGSLGFQVISLILFRIGIELEIPLVAAASIVYFEIEFVLSSLLLWGLANQLMTLRQGKRRFGFVSAGEPVAIIIFGLSMPLLLRWLEPADLFLLSALANGAGIVLALFILRRYRPAESVSQEEEAYEQEDTSLPQPWWHSNYIVTMVFLVIIGQFAYYFIDNAFYVEAGERYVSEASLASFLGIYSAIVGIVSLACSVLLTPWLLRRFGVRGGLLTLPVMLLIGSAAAVVAGISRGPADLLFLLVVATKIIDQSFRYTVDKTTFITLFQPLPPEQRMRIQAGLESMVEPITGGIAGLLLFVMINALGFGAVGITGVTLFVASLWIGVVAVQYRGYLGSLGAALSRRLVSSKNLSFDDDESRSILRQRLISSSSAEVLYCMSLMDSLELTLDPAEAAHLLHHDSREVRSEIARRIERGQLILPFHVLRSALATEANSEVKSLLIEGLAATGQDMIAEFGPWLDDPSESIQLGAAVGLMRHGGIEGVLKVGPRLLQDLNAIDPDRRRYAARLMGRVGSDNFYRPLLTLLQDHDTNVVREALRAAGIVAAPKLWPVMIEMLSRAELQRSAIAATAAVGDPVLPAIDAVLEQDDLDASLRYALVAVLGGIGTTAAEGRLLHYLATSNRLVRNRILRIVWRRRFRCHLDYVHRLPVLLNEEVEAAASALHAWARLEQQADDERVELVRRILADEVTRCVDNCFCLLSLRVSQFNVHEAYASYVKGGPARRAYVVEMLDNTLDSDIKTTLLPLLEPESMESLAAAISSTADNAKSLTTKAYLVQLAGDMRFSSLLRASAAYAAGETAQQNGNAQTSGDSVLLETVNWIRASCPPLEDRISMLTIEKLLVLKSVTVFCRVREEYLLSAAASAREVRLTKGQCLFKEGDFGTSLFVIVSGRLDVNASGKRVAELREREVVGEMAALDPEPRSATVSALEDSVLLKLTTEDLDLLMSEDVEVARGIIQTLFKRLRNLLSHAPLQSE